MPSEIMAELPVKSADRRAGDPAVLIASSERARSELGWAPSRTEIGRIVSDAWAFAQLDLDRH